MEERQLYMIAFGVALATVRRRGMWSQHQICEFAGGKFSQSALSRWENGTHIPDVYDIHLLKKFMGDMLFELADTAFLELKKLRDARSHRELQALAIVAAETHLRQRQ